MESLPFLYWVTLKVECLFSDLLNVFRVFGTLTMPTSVCQTIEIGLKNGMSPM